MTTVSVNGMEGHADPVGERGPMGPKLAVEMNNIKIFSVLAHALAVARKKHPVFADGAQDGWDVIEGELLELQEAIIRETEQRQFEEAIDVAVTAIRFALGEHKQN